MPRPDTIGRCSNAWNTNLIANNRRTHVTTIRLRIVGIFYDRYIDLPERGGGAKIKDLLDEAVRLSGGTFTYRYDVKTFIDSGVVVALPSVVSFSHRLEADLNPSLGGKTRKAGKYTLTEAVSVVDGSEIAQAWQYYVIRDYKAVSNAFDGQGAVTVSPASPTPPAKATFTPFTDFPLIAGDEVIWRNVSIVKNPAKS